MNSVVTSSIDITTSPTTDSNDITSVKYWETTVAYNTISHKMTQYQYYRSMNSYEQVISLVTLDSRSFGIKVEHIVKEIFKLDPRTSVQHDGTRHGKKIEIKSSRYWNGTLDCVWQHLEPSYDYDMVLFVLLGFNKLHVWGITKSLLMGMMRTKKIVTRQGRQGWWVKKSRIEPYITPINNISELDMFITRCLKNS